MVLTDINIRAYDECVQIYGQDFVDKHHPIAFSEVNHAMANMPTQLISKTSDGKAHQENMLYHSRMSSLYRTFMKDSMSKSQFVKPIKGLENKL